MDSGFFCLFVFLQDVCARCFTVNDKLFAVNSLQCVHVLAQALKKTILRASYEQNCKVLNLKAN